MGGASTSSPPSFCPKYPALLCCLVRQVGTTAQLEFGYSWARVSTTRMWVHGQEQYFERFCAGSWGRKPRV